MLNKNSIKLSSIMQKINKLNEIQYFIENILKRKINNKIKKHTNHVA